MFFILSKLLSFLISPIIWIITLLILALWIKKWREKLLISAIVVLFLFSNEFVYMEFMRKWEVLPKKSNEISEHYDAAIVLGGFTTYDKAYNMVGFHESSDRFLLALQLYKQKVVDRIIFSGGSGSLTNTEIKEAIVIKNYLTSIGIPERDLIVESESKNTRENAIKTAELVKNSYPNGSFLLITSGYHMRRAMGCFANTGLQITGYSVDRVAGPRKFYIDHLLFPNANILKSWNALIHEWLGYIMYRIMGYI